MTRKIALVHDWLTGMRGGEKILELLCDIFPRADIFTLVYVAGTGKPLNRVSSHHDIPAAAYSRNCQSISSFVADHALGYRPT